LRHALTSADAASAALPAGTIGLVVVIGADVDVVEEVADVAGDVVSLGDVEPALDEPPFEHAASAHAATTSATAAAARVGISPT
jgi:hypothetical protein